MHGPKNNFWIDTISFIGGCGAGSFNDVYLKIQIMIKCESMKAYISVHHHLMFKYFCTLVCDGV